MTTFMNQLKMVKGAVSKDLLRGSLVGVAVEYDDTTEHKKLILVATDGHRLSVSTYIQPDSLSDIDPDFSLALGDRPNPSKTCLGVILPEAINAITALGECDYDSSSGKYKFYVSNPISNPSGNYEIQYVTPSGSLIVPLINDGSYPSWERVIPAPGSRPLAEVSVKTLLSYLRNMHKDGYRIAKFSIHPDPGVGSLGPSIHMEGIAGEGDDRDTIKSVVVDYSGDYREVTLNISYLISAISVIRETSCEIGFGPDPRDPIFIKSKDSPEDSSINPLYGKVSYMAMIMPIFN